MELFDFIGRIFGDDVKWKEVTAADKRKHFFMTNRFLSIKYPYQVLHLSSVRVSAESTMDYWHSVLSGLFSKTPGWIYAKTIKRKEKQKKISYPTIEMIKWYCRTENLSPLEFEDKERLYGDEFIKYLVEEEKMLREADIL
jgi:hypothetical protein